MQFASPEGRRESLWVEELGLSTYRVLSVPVWVYGISVGSVVVASPASDDPLIFDHLSRASAGGTVRLLVRAGRLASEFYRTRVIPDAMRQGLSIGPATFFDPRVVAVHVREREKWWPDVGTYLDGLVSEGALEQWEVADPDEYAAEFEKPEGLVVADSPVLWHPLPVEGELGRHVS